MARRIDPDLRSRILAAATEAFATRGFAETTMEQIGVGAGVTKGGVYFHFRTKEQLFFALVDEARGRLREDLEGVARSQAHGAGTLQGLIAAWLGFHFDDPARARLLRVLAAELRGRFTSTLREDLRSEQRALRARVREALVRGNRDGTLFAEDPVLVAFLMVGALHGMVDQWLNAPEDVAPFCDAEALAEELLTRWRTAPRPPRRDETATAEGPPDGSAEEFRPPWDH